MTDRMYTCSAMLLLSMPRAPHAGNPPNLAARRLKQSQA